MSIIRLKVVKDSYNKTLDGKWTFSRRTQGRRASPQNRAFQDGAIDVSDGKFLRRTLSLRGLVYGTSLANYKTLLGEHYTAFHKEDFELYVVEDSVEQYYYRVSKTLKINEKFYSGQNYQAAVIDVTFQLTDPFLYGATGQNDTITVNSSPKSDTIANSGISDSYPIITVTADTSITSLIIENETDVPAGASDGLQFAYNDNAFVSTDELIIDCQEGTVEREGTNTIRYFSGSFLKLLPGNNTITVTCQTGGATTVEFDYPKREMI